MWCNCYHHCIYQCFSHFTSDFVISPVIIFQMFTNGCPPVAVDRAHTIRWVESNCFQIIYTFPLKNETTSHASRRAHFARYYSYVRAMYVIEILRRNRMIIMRLHLHLTKLPQKLEKAFLSPLEIHCICLQNLCMLSPSCHILPHRRAI